MILIGVDPDKSGGFATLHMGSNTIITLDRMPLWMHPVKNTPAMDFPAIHDLFLQARTNGADYVILESAIVRAQVSNKGTAMMGSIGHIHQNYGGIRALAESVFGRNRVIYAWPSTWKKAMGLSSDKEQSLMLARELHTGHTSLLSKKKNVGLAEAILLTHWAARHHFKQAA